MKKTDNYSLPQWEKQDFIKMEDFNDAFGKTDAALKANADATATGLNAEIAARGEAVAAEAENRSAADAALQASLAAAIGSPSASRAVGMANHHNPIPIVIPCHRVIGANGTLTGYAGGLEIKRKLLALEGITILK